MTGGPWDALLEKEQDLNILLYVRSNKVFVGFSMACSSCSFSNRKRCSMPYNVIFLSAGARRKGKFYGDMAKRRLLVLVNY